MEKDVQKRKKWIDLYFETKNAGLVCLKCGISRPTLRKWIRQYELNGLEGLASKSRKPYHSPKAKVNPKIEEIILDYRKKRNLGSRRIQTELIRNQDIKLSIATIHKVLKRNEATPLKKGKRKKHTKRYSCPGLGERVQMDVCQISQGLYQYTAVDDCSRYRVMRLYRNKKASNTIDFIDSILEEMPFPIQRIQTDRGTEFFAYKVQEKLMEYKIKFRPIKPGSPYLNGKVERSQQTDLQEFYATVNIKDNDIEDQLALWQHYYNWYRPHSSLSGLTPMDKVCSLLEKTPYWDDVYDKYDENKEHFKIRNYYDELLVRKLKQSL